MSAAEAHAFAAPEAEGGGPLSLVEAMSLARRSVALFTELKVDSVATCETQEQGWRVVVDVIEAKARMGDNDLLASYEVIISNAGEVSRYGRVGRYRRDDAARGG
jgi:hypothetical protein